MLLFVRNTTVFGRFKQLHPYVYRMIDALIETLPTEEQFTDSVVDSQIIDIIRARTGHSRSMFDYNKPVYFVFVDIVSTVWDKTSHIKASPRISPRIKPL